MRAYGIVRFTKDIEEGNNVYRVGVAENQYNFKTKENDGHFWNAVLFGKVGERLMNSGLGKGARINITSGIFSNNNYTKQDGSMVYGTQLKILDFEFVDKRESEPNADIPTKNKEQKQYDKIGVLPEDLPF